MNGHHLSIKHVLLQLNAIDIITRSMVKLKYKYPLTSTNSSNRMSEMRVSMVASGDLTENLPLDQIAVEAGRGSWPS
jgi:hypothetical protein